MRRDVDQPARYFWRSRGSARLRPVFSQWFMGYQGPDALPRHLTAKGVPVALLFLFFHKRLCGPLAHSRFHHKPHPAHSPNSKLEAAYHKADKAIEDIVDLPARWPGPDETVRTASSPSPMTGRLPAC